MRVSVTATVLNEGRTIARLMDSLAAQTRGPDEMVIVGGELQSAADDVTNCRYFPLDHLPKPIRDHLRQRIADYQRARPQTIFRIQ